MKSFNATVQKAFSCVSHIRHISIKGFSGNQMKQKMATIGYFQDTVSQRPIEKKDLKEKNLLGILLKCLS